MKNVPVIDEVHEDLKLIVKYEKKRAPHKSNTLKSAVAGLITKEARRIKKILGE